MPINTSITHGITVQNDVVLASSAAQRDEGVLFRLGKEAANVRAIPQFVGVVLSSGKRFVSSHPGVATYHCFWWTGDATTATLHQASTSHVDFIALGVDVKTISQLRSIILLEGEPTLGPPLHELLKLPEPEPLPIEGRVRIREADFPQQPMYRHDTRMTPQNSDLNETIRVDDIGSTRGPSESKEHRSEHEDALLHLSKSELFALQLSKCDDIRPQDTLFLAVHASYQDSNCFIPPDLTGRTIDYSDNPDDQLFETFCPSFPSQPQSTREINEDDNWLTFNADGTSEFVEVRGDCCYPVDRLTRTITTEELTSNAADVTAARKIELKSWVDNNTGKAMTKTDFHTESGGVKPIPSRWVNTFKLKQGKLITKCRLCLKEFAEPIIEDEAKASPTANRVSHRVVLQTAVQEDDFEIASLDVSVAFLKGFSFEQLKEKGISRRPIAFIPCEEVWSILAELDPVNFSKVLTNPSLWVFACEKAACGLRDAPLLWHLRAVECLKGHGYRPLLHDQCTFVFREPGSLKLSCILTLHVDDLLIAGTHKQIMTLTKLL